MRAPDSAQTPIRGYADIQVYRQWTGGRKPVHCRYTSCSACSIWEVGTSEIRSTRQATSDLGKRETTANQAHNEMNPSPSVHYPHPWIFLGVTSPCGEVQQGSGASCPYLNRLFEHPVQILPGLAGDNCLNSRRQRRLLFLAPRPRQIRRQRRVT